MIESQNRWHDPARLILLALFFVACVPVLSQHSKGKSQIRPIITRPSADFVLTFERTVCYGRCPSYMVRISADRRLRYEGLAFVKTPGPVTKRITNEDLRSLIDAIRTAKFFSLRNSYSTGYGCTSMSTDEPWIYISVQDKKRKKTVKHYLGCNSGSTQFDLELQRLVKLEETIDKIIDVQEWIGSEEERQKIAPQRIS